MLFTALMNLASRCVGLVNINRVSFHSREGQEFVHKQRTATGWILIILGNLVLRLRCVPVRVLYKREWMQWERDVKLVTRNEDVTLAKNLVCKKIPGESLSSLIRDEMQSSQKQNMLFVATESLKQFHETEIDVAGVGRCLLSHGDASITNVLYDPKTQLAAWFDFDLRHDFRSEAIERHADDLRSLLFSAVHVFSVDSIEDWIRSQRVAYPNEEVWRALANQLSSVWFTFDVFHHSQVVRSRKNCSLPAKELKQRDRKLMQAISNFG